ncbi:MAG: class I SAM-dependent methyltransferase [Planctomycetaceae bacterium]|nr:hypothetical protein [Planctomycetaceae bacterium]
MWKRVRRAWNKRGPVGFARLAWQNVRYYARLPFDSRIGRGQRFDHEFDNRYGTDTTGYVPIGALTVPAEHEDHAREYAPTDTLAFQAILARLEIDHSRYVFIDVGSGKGRTLLLASDYPFKRIIGVEFAREMHLVAVRNIAIYHSPTQKCTRLESVCADAVAFDLPDCPLVCFLNNPFDDVIMDKWLASLRRWAAGNLHGVYVVYHNCYHRALFDRSPHWQLVVEGGSMAVGDAFAIYQYIRESAPAVASAAPEGVSA